MFQFPVDLAHTSSGSRASSPAENHKKNMNSLPADVVGHILSCLASARDVACASATCRLWRHAADHHVHKLSFHLRDFQFIGKNRHADDDDHEACFHQGCMEIISRMVLRCTCLRDLSISDVHFNHAASLMAWLSHTKHTLKSLTLTSATEMGLSSVNLLQELLNPVIDHSGLPSLVSLTLQMGSTLPAMALQTGKDIEQLLSLFPSLISLNLAWHTFRPLRGGTHKDEQILVPSSLKKLHLRGFYDLQSKCSYDHLVLLGDNLQTLVLMNVGAQRITIFGSNLQYLHVHSIHDVVHIEARNLFSLCYLGINVQPQFLEQTLSGLASSTVRALMVGECCGEFVPIGKIISSSFPQVKLLFLYTIGHVPLRGSFQDTLKLEGVVSLVNIYAYKDPPDQSPPPDIVPQLIINHFPMLKRFAIAFTRMHGSDDAKQLLQSLFTPVLDHLRQRCPQLRAELMLSRSEY